MELSQAKLVVCCLKRGQLAHKVALTKLVKNKQTNKIKTGSWLEESQPFYLSGI